MWEDNGNRVYSWGAGMQGQLGLGEERSSVDIPHEVIELEDKNIVQVHANGDMSAALTDEGEIYVWGKSKGGSFGTSFSTNLMLPTKIDFKNEKFTSISLGYLHLAAVTEKGQSVTFGNPYGGKLGHTPKASRKNYHPTLYADKSEKDYVVGLDGLKITHVSCGKNHTVALT